MNNHYNRGLQFYNISRYADAIKSFKEFLLEEPNDYYSKYYLALCFYQLDEIESLGKITKSLLENHPDRDETHYLLSIYYFSIENIDSAYKHITEAISLDSHEANYFGYKAQIQIAKKQFEKALETANEGLKIDPKNSFSLNTRTKALTKLNRKEEAFETLQNTLQDNPNDYFTHANAGWTNLELGNHKKANIHFKEALQNNPNDEYAKEGMVESIKAKNFIYRYFLKYSFWIQNKSSKYQWGFIISLYLLYRFSDTLSQQLGFTFMIPILALLYFTFVLGSWIITPISSAILITNTYSKHLLSKEEKNTAIAFIFLSLCTILSTVLYYIFNSNYYLQFSTIAILCSIIPITHSLQKNLNLIKNIGFLYGVLIFALGLFNFIFVLNIPFLIPIIMFAIYTWLHRFIKS
ncbi:tetratricopeptide repeat protein [Tenacibaculum ovolyticum]|uniref:tetratricopeptide repeat protein n=1 Tax=Tenacibaculum ovolyticum TaxID=104270 RepID=UPI003BAC4423